MPTVALNPAHPLRPLALAALLALLPGLAWSQRFTLHELPIDNTWVNIAGIGDGGDLVGSFGAAEGVVTGFRFTRAGQLRYLTGTELHAAAFAVNAAGDAVGEQSGLGPAQAVHWSASGTATTLPLSSATGINLAGQVSGNAGVSAARWSPNIGLELLPGPHSLIGDARGINAEGAVVGTSIGPVGLERATLWRPGQLPLDLGTLPGSDSSRGLAVNNRGWVVGDSGGGFLWDPLNGMRAIEGLLPLALNDAGQVVGRSNSLSGAILWNERTGSHDLGALIGNASVTSAAGINRHAQVALETNNGGLGGGLVLTLHPDWEGGNGSWHDGAHWNWAGTGVASAQLGTMHQARIVVSEPTRVQLDADARVLSLALGDTGSAQATLALQGQRLDVVTTLRVGAGGVLEGSGTVGAGEGVVVEAGGAIALVDGELLQLQAPLTIDHGELHMQLGGRLDIAGALSLDHPLLKLSFGTLTLQAGQHYNLLDWNGSASLIDGAFSVQIPLLPEGLILNYDNLWVDGSVSIQAVPEPANALLLALGLGAIGWRRWASAARGADPDSSS